jgi:predicted branched-subunit amino acid permease
LRDTPRARRALIEHVLTDEAFALSIAHFERLGRSDERGYWVAAIGSTFIPWNVATFAGVTVGAQIPDPTKLGLDVVFPAAMIGLAVGLVTGRRELVAALSGALLGVAVSLLAGPGVGVIVGGLGGPLIGMAVPREEDRRPVALGTPRSAERYAMPGARFEPSRDHDGRPVLPPDSEEGLP